MKDGTQISNYTIVKRIGAGGMSIVYLAQDRSSRLVVLKQLKEQFSEDPDFVTRFRQAASIMMALKHPHIARALGYMEVDGYCLLVEEYLPGGSLEDRIKTGDPISDRQALIWCQHALLGVNAAHEHGIIHRDLKPGNLMFSETGAIKVTDFGIAKAFGGPRLTRTRSEMGTPAYMSPEQIRLPDDVYHLTDVYSMGVVLYELLTKELPFDEESDFYTKQAVVRDPPPPLRSIDPEIPEALEEIVLKALEKDLDRRYGGCAEFAGEIELYLRGVRPRTTIMEWASRHPFVVLFALLILVLVLVSILFGR